MSEIASVVERTHKAFASVSQLEAALAHAPTDRALQLNLSAMRKMALQAQEQLYAYSRQAYIDVCNYRLLPENEDNKGYSLQYVSQSFLEYQNLFTQIYDALKNGAKKTRAIFGREAQEESALEFAYSYGGSLGIVLFSHSERDLLTGKLDSSIDALYHVIETKSRGNVREVAQRFGNPVVKRLYDWSGANAKGGFAADVRWNRSDGRALGEVIPRKRMEEIVEIIDATSDSTTTDVEVLGILFGGNIGSRSFHFVVPEGDVYRGHLSKDFNPHTQMTLGKWYRARIRLNEKYHYATEKAERVDQLLSLDPDSSLPFPA
jgi:hypothetical protein